MFGLMLWGKTDIRAPRIKKGEDRNLRPYPRFAENFGMAGSRYLPRIIHLTDWKRLGVNPKWAAI